MPTCTTLLQSLFDEISPEDDYFIEELLDVAQLFRPFSEGRDELSLAMTRNGKTVGMMHQSSTVWISVAARPLRMLSGLA